MTSTGLVSATSFGKIIRVSTLTQTTNGSHSHQLRKPSTNADLAPRRVTPKVHHGNRCAEAIARTPRTMIGPLKTLAANTITVRSGYDIVAAVSRRKPTAQRNGIDA